MDTKALGMAIFMGLYVPLFTGISVTIHRLTHRTPKQSDKIIIVHRQFEKQSFDDANNKSTFNLDKSQNFSFSNDVLQVKSLHFYKLLAPKYMRDDNLFQNFDLNNIAIVESKLHLQKLSQNK